MLKVSVPPTEKKCSGLFCESFKKTHEGHWSVRQLRAQVEEDVLLRQIRPLQRCHGGRIQRGQQGAGAAAVRQVLKGPAPVLRPGAAGGGAGGGGVGGGDDGVGVGGRPGGGGVHEDGGGLEGGAAECDQKREIQFEIVVLFFSSAGKE